MKLYNEKEIGSILKRAAEMSADDALSTGSGLTIEELQQIGSEAGLNPDMVLKAAAELQRSGPERERNFFGGPISYSNELVVEGEIDAELWEEILASIRNTFKDPGSVTSRTNVFEWTSQSETEKAQVTAHVLDGKTRVSLFWAEPVVAVPMFVPAIIGTIISLPVTFEALNLSGLAATMVILTTFMTLSFLGRFGVMRYTDRQAAKLQQLETSIDLIASKAALRKARKSSSAEHSGSSATVASSFEGPSIELDDAESESNTAAPSRQRWRE